MRRRIKKPGNPQSNLRIVPAVTRTKTAEARIAELRLQTDIVRLKASGMDINDIASSLDIPKPQAVSLLARGLEEYHAARNDEVQRYIALQLAQYDIMIRELLPRSLTHEVEVEVEENGEKKTVKRTVLGDLEAGRLLARVFNDRNRMMGTNRVRVEHTGANGTPLTLDSNWSENLTDEQLEKLSTARDIGVVRGLLGRSGSGAGGT